VLIGHQREKHWWPQQLYIAQLTNVALLKSQPIPPSVREILTAYTAKGSDADREVLLAILQAKAAEDQRISALAALNQQYVVLQRHALEATALAMRQQQRQRRPSSSSPPPHAQSNLPQQQQRQRRSPGTINGDTTFPLSPYSNTSSGRSPSPPTPHLTAIPVPTSTAPPVLKRKHEDTLDADADAASSLSATRQHSQRRRNNSPPFARGSPSVPPSQRAASPNSQGLSISPRVPPAHGGSHSRTTSQSSSHSQAQLSSSAAVVAAESPSPGLGSAKHSPAYRRLDINSVLSNRPPISALRGGGGEPVDES